MCAATVARAKKLWMALVEIGRAEMLSGAQPYHPEQHYMRGPGPKWHAKHSRASTSRIPQSRLPLGPLIRALFGSR